MICFLETRCACVWVWGWGEESKLSPDNKKIMFSGKLGRKVGVVVDGWGLGVIFNYLEKGKNDNFFKSTTCSKVDFL